MNDDLISRDKLIDNLKTHFDALYKENGELLISDNVCNSEDVNDLIELANKQPTAYKVDKVLHEYRKLIKEYEDDGYSFHISSKVEDIIRGGGIGDN